MPAQVHPLLSPYVCPAPEGSLTLVTSVSDATSNWLLLQYIQAALISSTDSPKTTESGNVQSGNVYPEDQTDFRVIFVNVLRGFGQWQEMGKKVVGQFPRIL